MPKAANDNRQERHAALELRIFPEGNDLYMLERLRISMRAATREEAIRVAFKEFAQKCGVAFFGESPDMSVLSEKGYGNDDVEPIRRAGKNALVVWLPIPDPPDFEVILMRRTRSMSFEEVIQKALRRAYVRFVR